MNLRDAMYFVEDLMVKNHFNLLEEGVCLYTNEEKINSMQNIFKLKNKSDFTYLHAVSELLSDDYENINNYLLKENVNFSLIQNIKEPTRDDKLLVATAFRENPEFFSMAWNWVAIVTAELAELAEKSIYKNDDNIIHIDFKHNQSFDLDYPVYVSAAGVPGFNNITRIQIDSLGELEIRGNSETKRLIFVLFVNPKYTTLKFELKIKFQIENSENIAIIKKDCSDSYSQISSQVLHVNFTKGFRITKIDWKLL